MAPTLPILAHPGGVTLATVMYAIGNLTDLYRQTVDGSLGA